MVAGTRKLRTILVGAGVLSEADASNHAEAAARESRPFASVLVGAGVLSERDLIGHVARSANLPPIDLSRLTVNEELLQVIPQDVALDYGVFPVAKVGDVLTVAVADPFDVLKLDDLRIITGCTLRAVVSTEDAVKGAVERAFSPGETRMQELLGDLEGSDLELKEGEVPDERVDLSELSSDESPVVKMVNALIHQALKEGASDIHVEPFEKKVRVRYRVDGLLRDTIAPPKRMQSSLVSRIKIMSNLDIAEKFKPQDGKFQIKFEGRQIDFRVSCLPVVHGEKVVMRILDASKLALSLDKLGFEQKALDDYRTAIQRPYGMILVTGPTGSGKSTTLYSALRELMSDDTNIVTVEDPVEYQIEGVNQVPVNPKRGVTFPAALRSILRQDPDIILIGEIRDAETIDIAVKAALTGHLVLSTLHTNDAPSTVTRMCDMGLDPFMVASATLLICAQRLGRTLCQHCREPHHVPEETLIGSGFTPEEAATAKLLKAVGCPRCSGGYKGRFALLETMAMTEEVKRRIVNRDSVLDLKKQAVEQGMLTLRRCGILNALRGRTSLEEILRVTMPD